MGEAMTVDAVLGVVDQLSLVEMVRLVKKLVPRIEQSLHSAEVEQALELLRQEHGKLPRTAQELEELEQLGETLVRKLEQLGETLEAVPSAPRKSLRGLWQGLSITEEEIDEARREMWGGFPRSDTRCLMPNQVNGTQIGTDSH